MPDDERPAAQLRDAILTALRAQADEGTIDLDDRVLAGSLDALWQMADRADSTAELARSYSRILDDQRATLDRIVDPPEDGTADGRAVIAVDLVRLDGHDAPASDLAGWLADLLHDAIVGEVHGVIRLHGVPVAFARRPVPVWPEHEPPAEEPDRAQ